MRNVVLFDLDGTILNTLPDLLACCNDTLARAALPSVSAEEVRAFVGNGAKKLVERMLKGRTDRFDAVFADYMARFPAYTERTALYPGERAALDRLAAEGFRFAVVSNKPDAAARAVVTRFFGEGYFSAVVGMREGTAAKPDPTSARAAMAECGARCEDCVFVGDGETDAETARRLGIPFLGVLWGYRDRETLRAAGATAFAETYEELRRILSAQRI